jgi:hypothetical protein
MEVKDALAEIINGTEELFIRARDKGHAESMRVTAFNIRRRMPEQITGNIGIQAICDKGIFFLRVFNRGMDGAEIFVRDKETGELIPAPEVQSSEMKRIIELMKKDGKTEEEIKEALSNV